MGERVISWIAHCVLYIVYCIKMKRCGIRRVRVRTRIRIKMENQVIKNENQWSLKIRKQKSEIRKQVHSTKQRIHNIYVRDFKLCMTLAK